MSNIYLHHVLDDWFEKQAKPRLKGKCFLIRYADDFVLGCELEEDARRMMNVLPKRFAKYGLTIHPTKTKLIRFKRPNKWETSCKENGTFDFLGFTHFWTRSLKKNWVIKRKTMRKRLNRALKRIRQWCKDNLHMKFKDHYKTLCAKVRGHYNYYGIRGNIECLMEVYRWVQRSWKYWLNKRSQRGYLTWVKFYTLLEKYPIPMPKIVQKI